MIKPLAVAVRVVKKLRTRSAKRLVVLGSGAIGLFMIRLAKKYGIEQTVCTDIDDYNLSAARSFGADRAVNVSRESLDRAILQTFGEKADAAVVAAMAPSIMDQALSSVKPKGLVLLLSTSAKPLEFSVFPLVNTELDLQGHNAFSVDDFAEVVDLVDSGKVEISPFATDVFPIDDIAQAMEMIDSRSKKFIKVIMRF